MKKLIDWATFKTVFGRDHVDPGDEFSVNDTLMTVSRVGADGVEFYDGEEPEEEELEE